MLISDWSSDVCSSDLLAVAAALLLWLRKQSGDLLIWAVGLVAGGAVGNAIDRFHQPGVVDFLDLHLAGWHWPAFNVADSAIVCGVLLIVADGLFPPGRKGNKGRGSGGSLKLDRSRPARLPIIAGLTLAVKIERAPV